MSRPKPTEIVVNERGDETHPSFGWAQVSRVTSSPGQRLFDSEIEHGVYVMLRISPATRKRDIQQDWIHEEGRRIVEVAMSVAQWGALVSSFGSGGVPVTISELDMEMVPDVARDQGRLEGSIAETKAAAHEAFGEIEQAAKALREAFEAKAGRKEMAERLRALEIRLSNAPKNVAYAAETLAEHVENVVIKAKFDIEAMAQRHMGTLALSGPVEVPALEVGYEEAEVTDG